MSEPISGTLQNEASAALSQRDYQKAFPLYESLALAGSTMAMIITGWLCLKGLGTKQSYDKSRDWFNRAYELGDVFGAIWLHGTYFHGYGVDIDDEKALKYVKHFEHIECPKSIAEAIGISALAGHYELGRGVRRNVGKAMMLNRRAAATGHLVSRINLERRRVLRGNLFALPAWLWTVCYFHILKKRCGGRHNNQKLW